VVSTIPEFGGRNLPEGNEQTSHRGHLKMKVVRVLENRGVLKRTPLFLPPDASNSYESGEERGLLKKVKSPRAWGKKPSILCRRKTKPKLLITRRGEELECKSPIGI